MCYKCKYLISYKEVLLEKPNNKRGQPRKVPNALADYLKSPANNGILRRSNRNKYIHIRDKLQI